MPGRSPRCSSFAFLLLFLLGCGGDEKELRAPAAEHGPAIERNLAAWPGIAEQLHRLHPLAQQGISRKPPFTAGLPVKTALCYAEDPAS
jgi:hypothetical protein